MSSMRAAGCLALLVLGCNKVDPADAYELSIAPITPFNQADLFTEVESLTLVVDDPAAGVSEWSLDNLGSGQQSVQEGIPLLDGALISLELRNAASQLVGFGRSDTVSISEGTQTIDLLVAEVNDFGWMANLAVARSGGALVADGQGRMLLFGGSEDGLYGTGSALSDVLAFNLAPPDQTLAFTSIGEMPPRFEDEPDDARRMGHTATLLTVSHPDQGKILVVGGSTDYQECADGTYGLFLWDPITDEHEVLSGRDSELPNAQFLHAAVENHSGAIVLAGGLTSCSTGSGIINYTSISIYEPHNRTTEPASGTASGPLIMHAAARLGEVGVLICGGAEYTVSGGFLSSFLPSAACDLVTDGGLVEPLTDTTASGGLQELLPIGLSHHQMTTLADGQVLATGGIASDSQLTEGTATTASKRAFVFDGSQWREVGPMLLPRAMHGTTLLPNGQVLVAGGVYETDSFFWNSGSPLACAELYDPVTESFTSVAACTEDDAIGPMPVPVSLPMVASDPLYGAMVVGGLGDGYDGTIDSVLLFMGKPPTN